MLTAERHARIVEMVARQGTVTVPELASALDISESTIRRDLDKLDQAHRLVKVHGGATTLESAHLTRDLTLEERHGLHAEEKRAICAYAATLVGPDDLVYLDAGSTVEELINHLAERGARYVTDSVSHAMKLAARGFHVTVLGGELKSATESLVGPDTIAAISRYHFTIGFWGVNGITPENGLTSPESNEALIKQLTMEHTARRYVLADATKFDNTSLVRFGAFDSATIVTCGDVPEKYKAYTDDLHRNVQPVARLHRPRGRHAPGRHQPHRLRADAPGWQGRERLHRARQPRAQMTRINVKVKSAEETELNGMGPKIAEKDVEVLLAKLDALGEGDTLVISGSVPATLPHDMYERIMARLEGRGVCIVVDAEKDLLTRVLRYRPFLVKPNNHELGDIFGVTLRTRDEVVPYAKRLQELGAANVLVSMAGEGGVLVDETGAVRQSPAAKGTVVNSVGAGDSSVAGFLAGLIETGSYEDAFRMALAAGSASAFSDHLATRPEVEALLARS